MGLGKTLTMISLILSQKAKGKEEGERKEEKKLEKWISKNGKFKKKKIFLLRFRLLVVLAFIRLNVEKKICPSV